MVDGGTYTLVLDRPGDSVIEAGALGEVDLPISPVQRIR